MTGPKLSGPDKGNASLTVRGIDARVVDILKRRARRKFLAMEAMLREELTAIAHAEQLHTKSKIEVSKLLVERALDDDSDARSRLRRLATP